MLNISEPKHLSEDWIGNIRHFNYLCRLVKADGNNGITNLEMIVASCHIEATKLVHSSLPKNVSERVQTMDKYRGLDERWLQEEKIRKS